MIKPDQAAMADAISLTDPAIILAGIKTFGLAPDGSDLTDLADAITRLRAELQAEQNWRLSAVAERDAAVKRADDADQKSIGWENSYDSAIQQKRAVESALAAERTVRERMREALRDCSCPRPINLAPEDSTIGQCVDGNHCGCKYGIALAPPSPSAGEPVKPHDYFPSALHMGDCDVCGNVQDHPLHVKWSDEEMVLARKLCQQKCRALMCERLGRCGSAYPAPGDGWFEGRLLAAREQLAQPSAGEPVGKGGEEATAIRVIADTLEPGLIGEFAGGSDVVALDIVEHLEKAGFAIERASSPASRARDVGLEEAARIANVDAAIAESTCAAARDDKALSDGGRSDIVALAKERAHTARTIATTIASLRSKQEGGA